MKKNRGYTLLEILIAVAMMAIFASLLAPLGSAFTKSHNKLKEVNEIDLELSKTAEIIKRTIRAAQEDGTNLAVMHPLATDDAGDTWLKLTVSDGNGGYNYILFWHSGDEFRVTQTADSSVVVATAGSGSLLMTGVDEVRFRYKENIVTMYFKVTKGGLTREIRDAGVTRIDYQISKKVTF